MFFISDSLHDKEDEPRIPKKLFMKDNASLFFEDNLIEIFKFVSFEDLVVNISNVCSDWNKTCWKSVSSFLIKEEWNKNLTNKYIKYIVKKKCTRIQKLTCHNNVFVTSEHIFKIFTTFHEKMNYLYLNMPLKDEELQEIIKNCPNIEHLYLGLFLFF
jgi:galactitol-specific phosphotransferase system IIB component